MDDLVREFLVESSESLDQMDLDFIELEKDPANLDTLASVFRAIHTIKGTCGFLGFEKLEALTHVGETLLGQLRDGQLACDSEIATALLALSDAVRQSLAEIEDAGTDSGRDDSELIKTLKRLQAGEGERQSRPDAPGQEPETAFPDASAEDVAPAANAPQTDGADAAPGKGGTAAGKQSSSVAESSVRVDVGLLDSLMNQVGELVLARNQIHRYSASQEDPVFLTAAQRLNLITTELQEGVMKTRMQPIGTIWNKFPRVVRDLSQLCGKQVRIDMEGEETELDRTIIEAIKDPLTHVVRNSVDHGIEAPEDRRAAGKPEEGCINLRAFHEGGQVIIEISDDGKGIDVERVVEKAIAANVISRTHAASMGEREALNLIFSPGLSTAAAVTNISGRGVGMDVVKTNVERIGGTVDIQTEIGRGSTLRVKIPLTLAIIPALVVTSRGDSFAIPQVSLVELVRLDGEQATSAIEMIHDVPVYRLRGNLLPMVWLNEQLNIGGRDRTDGAPLNIAVLQADDRQFGLVVDEINDNQEIVVKPLGKLLKGLTCFAGATIMGDGKVALILDALGLAQRAGVISRARDAFTSVDARSVDDGGQGETQTLLLFSTDHHDQLAVPLSKVARLEEFDSRLAERAGAEQVIQYRGRILPLIDLSAVLGGAPTERRDGPMQVVVYTEDGFSVGVVVSQILDIVEQRISVVSQVSRPGVLGTAIVQDRVTEIVDIGRAVQMAGIEMPRPVST